MKTHKQHEPERTEPKSLKVGRRYLFELITGGKANTETMNGKKLKYKATVLAEYDKFYLMDTGKYLSTLHKYAVGNEYKAKEIKS